MNFSYYIAKRYLFSKSKRNAINIISLISGIAVFVGALALMIVLSGFSGLREFGLSYTNEYNPDLKVLPASGKLFGFSSEKKKALSQIKGITAFSEVIEERVLLNFESKNMPAFIKGVDENYLRVNKTDSAVFMGSWLTKLDHQVVVGYEISRQLSLGVNDYTSALRIMVPKPGKGQITSLSGAFNTANAFVAGIFSINEELDGKYVFSQLSFARDLLNIEKSKISSLEIKLGENADSEAVKEKINSILKEEVIIQNRLQQNESLYKMYNTENLAVYLICTLVLIIALFNMIGAIIMVILDKRENIKTLYNLGANLKQLKRIFFLQGALTTLIGGVLGIVTGAIIVLLQLKLDLVMITPTLPYPIALTLENVLVVFFTIMILGIGTSYIASSRVKKALEHQAN
ncbi:MAG TPA: FtsX-like permease family protein [Flavobacteriaceae bacterium]|nr:FtsX-like permease family protein [Flavobacteriaceae bacterium]